MQRDTMQVLKRKIDSLPSGIEKLLQQILDSIDPSDRRKAFETFEVMLTAGGNVDSAFPNSEGMAALWYLFWDNAGNDPGFLFESKYCIKNHQELQSRLRSSQYQIQGAFKGLLTVADWPEADSGLVLRYRIQFPHRTIVDFLNEPRISADRKAVTRDFNSRLHYWLCFAGSIKFVDLLLGWGIYRTELRVPLLKMVEEFLHPPEGVQPRFCSALDTRGFCEMLTDLLRHCEERFDFSDTFFEPQCRRLRFYCDYDLPDCYRSPAILTAKDIVCCHWFHEWLSANLMEFKEMTNWPRTGTITCAMLMNSFDRRMGPTSRRRWLETVEDLFHNRLIPSNCGIRLSEMSEGLMIYLCRRDNLHRRTWDLTDMIALFLVYLHCGGDLKGSCKILALSSSYAPRTRAMYHEFMLGNTRVDGVMQITHARERSYQLVPHTTAQA